ncbi:CBS [[Actinomadura] parvosata subsp. kistnae]|uniref:CBS domain-containing protein n=1 Tax=[Actinomadura] parvosata subsp. kistnae TaxID=1909395 RepID=A0A1U9ZYX4_9ACTN|nr:CBS domain-containing protein [Nonomuraea sp. ATCC 55076]AQZ63130.1 CBS domain-containing protein [Nonomuraea sp. ATCC 55076]SPL98767.1 CBS [Actinomadura parvosata subsp. kistnae]
MTVEVLTAGQVMSRVLVAVKAAESPLMAWELMRRAGVHHLPVVDGRRVLGVLTREELAASWSGGPQEQSTRHVRDLLGRDRRPQVHPETSLTAAAGVMLDAGLDAVPVVSGAGLIGLITVRDVLAAVAGRLSPAQQTSEVLTGMFHLEPVLPKRTEPVLPAQSWRQA